MALRHLGRLAYISHHHGHGTQLLQAAAATAAASAPPQPPQQHRANPHQLELLKDQIATSWPMFFQRPYNYQNHTQDILLIDNIRSVRTQGIGSYALQVNLMKCSFMIRYTRLAFHILNIVQHSQESYIKVRWRIEGQPGVLYMLMFFWKSPMRIQASFEGISTLYVNKDGAIDCHVVDNIELDVVEKANIASVQYPGTLSKA